MPIIRPIMEWNLGSNVSDVLSLGPRTSAKLLRLGVQSVAHLLAAKPHLLSVRMADARITWKMVACWQRETRLRVDLPELNAGAARILAMAEFSSPTKIARSSPTELVTALERLDEEQREWAGWAPSRIPDFGEVSRWIAIAQDKIGHHAA
ncbi:MAG: DUF4332 domain-containing protein [Pirellulales bacterium]|nr:DUF4332 domain-containing protein [Pirellulales bacterium]